MIIIAESAFNHNGSLSYLIQLANKAKETKTDYFTVQVMNVADFCSADYEKYELYLNNTLSFKDWEKFFIHCEKISLKIIPCVLDQYSLEFCYNYGFRFLKLHATDITNIPMLDFIADKKDISVILETQCATNIELKTAIRKLGKQVRCIMHGFSDYPTEIEDLNLNSIDYLQEEYKDFPIGFADHSVDVTHIPLMVLAKGCAYLEKHITLSRSNRNFDWQVSLYPDEFSSMVKTIKHYEKSLGIWMKHPVKNEMKYRPIIFKKFLNHSEYKRANSGKDYLTETINSYSKINVGVALIARLKSQRLTKKVLRPLHDTFLIDFLYQKLSQSKKVNQTFLSTSNLVEDQELVSVGKSKDYQIYEGNAHSVIDRMLELAIQEQFGAIFRVTGDNPFTDINLIDEMVDLLQEHDLDYVRVTGVPFGVSAELFSTSYLWKLYLEMENPMVSEYLTLFVLNDESAKKGCIDVISKVSDLSQINLSVDYPVDLENARKLIEAIILNNKDPYEISLIDIIEHHESLHREDINKQIKLPLGEKILLSEFLDKLYNQDFFVRKKIEFK